MRTSIFILIFLISNLPVFSQSRPASNILVIDAKSKKPLPACNVIIKHRNIGTTTNPDGYLTFGQISLSNKDTVCISYIGYETYQCTAGELKGKIKLKPKPEKLPEVTIVAEKFKLEQFLKNLIKKYNKKDKQKPNIAIAHYREKAKKNGRFIMFAESIGYSIYSGTVANAAPLSNYKFLCENSRLFITSPSWIEYTDLSRSKTSRFVHLGNSSTLNALRMMEVAGLLKVKNLKQFRFQVDSSFVRNGDEFLKIAFNNKHFEGYLLADKSLEEIESIYYTTDTYFSDPFKKRLVANVSMKFKYFEGQPYVTSISSQYENDGLTHFNDLTILVQKFTDFSLTDQEYWNINSYSACPYINYLPNEWKKYNIPEDKDYATICKDLGKSPDEMGKHYLKFSGQWFCTKTASHQEKSVIELITNLKKRF